MALQNISAIVDNKGDYIDIFLNSRGNLIVKILNVHGLFIKTVIGSIQDTAEKISVKLDDLSSGSYVLNIFKDNSFIRSFHYSKT